MTNTIRNTLTTTTLLAAAAAVAVALIAHGTSLHALQGMIGGGDGTSDFGKLSRFLSNLRDGLIPLAVPVGGLGMVAGGAMYMLGNPLASKILGGVVIGLVLVIGAPSIIK